MYLPPESHNSMPLHSESTYPLLNSEQDHPLLQWPAEWNGQTLDNPYGRDFSLREAPAPAIRGRVIRSRVFRPQDWVGAFTLPRASRSQEWVGGWIRSRGSRFRERLETWTRLRVFHPQEWLGAWTYARGARERFGALTFPHPFRAQKWSVALILLLITGIVLAVPLLSWRLFFPARSTSTLVHPRSTVIHTIVTSLPTPSPLPIGTTIAPAAGKIMTGISMTDNVSVINTFEKSIGKDESILSLAQDWGATGGDENFPTSWASSIRAAGSIPMITWQPWITKKYPLGNNESMYALNNIIAGNFDTYIKQWAHDAKAWKNPLFLRFAFEMNGNWTPWSEILNGNKAGEFVRMWRHVHDIFTSVGVTNVTWVWNPNVNYNTSIPLAELYPGDAYVDWTAIDGFNWGTHTKGNVWLTFSQVYGPTYNDILTITKKPIMLAQTGSTEKGGNKAAWITNAYTVALPSQFPSVKAIVWFNQYTQDDWRVNSSATALRAYSQALQSPIYAGNIYGNYLGG